MEAGEYPLTRGTCLIAHRIEVVAVAGLLWISWCVWGSMGYRGVFGVRWDIVVCLGCGGISCFP